MVIGVGGGTRVRHTISIAADLGLPVGGMAQLVGAMEELNAILLNTLLAPHGSMPMQRDTSGTSPSTSTPASPRSRSACRRITSGSHRRRKAHLRRTARTSACFQLADVLGMKQAIFVKDEDGLYDKDPKKHKDAKKFGKITLAELNDAVPPRTTFSTRSCSTPGGPPRTSSAS